jgi:3-hydroxyisobutyrate dehydrogenase-like beta-hydroxyacid dehydrogenase
LIYIDANAVSPNTTSEISKLLTPLDVVFIDGSVLGGPAKGEYCPKLYLSADAKWDRELKEVEEILGGWADGKKGLNIRLMEGAGEGAASALKMCYGGINKGYVGLATLLILSEWHKRDAGVTSMIHIEC